MVLDPQSFGASLLAEIRAGRSFGAHPLWQKIELGKLSLPQLQGFARQFYLQVVEFPRAVSALHSRCPDRAERVKLAESVYEEETGRISGTKPHPDLFLDFCAGIGLRAEEVVTTPPLPSTAALIHWFDYATKLLSFLEGVAAINLAAEGQVVGAFGPFAQALRRHYGLSDAEVAFWDVHEIADADHSAVGDHIVVRNAQSDEAQAAVRRAVRTSLSLWVQFFDGMDREYGAV